MIATVTVAEAVAEPPLPVQVIEYVVVFDGAPVRLPDIPVGLKLVPVQLVAFVDDQLNVDCCPELIDVGFAESVTVGVAGGGGGGGGGGGTTVPPCKHVGICP